MMNQKNSKSNQKKSAVIKKNIKNTIKICYWKCARGIVNKKHLIEDLIKSKSLDVLFIAECDLNNIIIDSNMLKIEGYDLIFTNNLAKRDMTRMCAYIKTNRQFNHRSIDEKDFNDIIILECEDKIIAGIYRPFKCHDGESQVTNFERLIQNLRDMVKKYVSKDVTIIGDFNVDYGKMHETTDPQKNIAKILNDFTDDSALKQLIKGITRHRLVGYKNGNKIQTSLLDHLYTTNPQTKLGVYNENMPSSDHNAIGYEFESKKRDMVTKKQHKFTDAGKTIAKKNFKMHWKIRIYMNFGTMRTQKA